MLPRLGGAVVVALVLALTTGCGQSASNETAGPRPAPDRQADPYRPADPSKVAPRWERVATFAGTGDQRTTSFAIAGNAIQWRVTARCTGGRLGVALADEPAPLVEPTCPGQGFGFSIRTGDAALQIAASDDWEAVVDQQVDTPISEPPPPGATPAGRLAEGSFYGIDQQSSGTATLYRLPDGQRALRLDPFVVTANSDLFVWVSEAEAPRTSEEAFRAPHVQVDRLKATAGAQNYVLPAEVATDRARSVVVWCEPVRTAYAAATLARP